MLADVEQLGSDADREGWGFLPAWTPLLLAAFGIGAIGIGVYIVQRLRDKYRRGLVAMKPMEQFLVELTRCASPGHDQALLGMLPSEVLRTVEKGTIRAMGRCVVGELGQFKGIDPFTFQYSRQRQRDPERTVFVARGACNFSRSCCPINVSVTWYKQPETGRAQVLGFQFAPDDHKGPLKVTKYVDPSDFQAFGEKFVTSLLTTEPRWAHHVMIAGLQSKYPEPTALADEIVKVLRVCGGIKGKEPDITFVGGEKAVISDENGVHGLVLRYHVAGKRRDMAAEVKLGFVGLRCLVVRYELRAEPSKEKQMIVDQDSGERHLLSD